METSGKIRILALHGYRQNGATFKSKTGSLRKTINKIAEIVYLTAPHKVTEILSSSSPSPLPENTDNQPTDEDLRGWWFNAEDHTFSGKRVGGPAIGFTETLNLITETFQKEGPFDGILGFSQGACLAGILSAMQQKGLLKFNFRFVILVSGFCSGSLVHKLFYNEEIHLPSLHVYGDTDQIIPKEMSETLAARFNEPLQCEHSGGHYLACSGKLKYKYRDFIGDIKEELGCIYDIDMEKGDSEEANPKSLS